MASLVVGSPTPPTPSPLADAAYGSSLEAQLSEMQQHTLDEAAHTAGCIAALAAELAACEAESIVSREALRFENTRLRDDNAMLRGAVHRLHLQLLCASADVQTLRAEVRSAEEAGAAESASAQRLQHSSVRVAESRRQQDAHARGEVERCRG